MGYTPSAGGGYKLLFGQKSRRRAVGDGCSGGLGPGITRDTGVGRGLTLIWFFAKARRPIFWPLVASTFIYNLGLYLG